MELRSGDPSVRPESKLLSRQSCHVMSCHVSNIKSEQNKHAIKKIKKRRKKETQTVVRAIYCFFSFNIHKCNN